MRILCFLAFVIISILEISPIPITPILLIWAVLFRPVWFYELMLKIYAKTKTSGNVKNNSIVLDSGNANIGNC